MIDAISLAQDLIRCPSVTPKDAGALDVLERALTPLGFHCQRLRFEEEGTAGVDNLYARLGTTQPNLGFAGHTDVVPVGDVAAWTVDPFGGEIRDGVLYGRGAADMKSAIAAFVEACARVLEGGRPKGSISLLITGDEEGVSINGTRKMLGWMRAQAEQLDHCLVGEPTAAARSGDTVKIGRRGSMYVSLTVRGIQGHTAYPQRALNPIPILATLASELAGEPLDGGTEHFEPSTLVFTSFDVGNTAGNVSPAVAQARCNIRFNELHTPQQLEQRLRARADAVAARMGGQITLETRVSGEAFLTKPGAFTELIARAVRTVTTEAPLLSTGGGTSDARFIKDMCPVAELGLPGTTMHKVDECMPVCEIAQLTDIYTALLKTYFASPPR
ncbi:MAG: succinyl-diaminopimelate desuccinylase [Rhizomicrobium sp.]